MNGVILLPAVGRAKVPWKNGGGVTQTIAAFPEDAGPDAFMWRVSIAEVRTAGPFSAFPETDRHLSVLEGTLQLDVAGRLSTLSAVSKGLAFCGDVAASGTPVDGPVLDLNVMTRRGRFRAEVERLRSETPAPIRAEIAILVVTTTIQVEFGGNQMTLDRLDALRISSGIGQRLSIHADEPAHLIQIFSDDRTAELD